MDNWSSVSEILADRFDKLESEFNSDKLISEDSEIQVLNRSRNDGKLEDYLSPVMTPKMDSRAIRNVQEAIYNAKSDLKNGG